VTAFAGSPLPTASNQRDTSGLGPRRSPCSWGCIGRCLSPGTRGLNLDSSPCASSALSPWASAPSISLSSFLLSSESSLDSFGTGSAQILLRVVSPGLCSRYSPSVPIAASCSLPSPCAGVLSAQVRYFPQFWLRFCLKFSAKYLLKMSFVLNFDLISSSLEFKFQLLRAFYRS
jgi:hypothetical protein